MTTEVLSDGTVELSQRWLPGGAQGNLDQLFENGEQYIFAVRIIDGHGREVWEFYAIAAACDPESPVEFYCNGDPWDDWAWYEVDWFVPARDFNLPSKGVSDDD